MQLVQQNTTAFATIFVYDSQGFPIWYTATLNYLGLDQTGAPTYGGDLYFTNGPWFGTVPFNPAQVTLRNVGTLTFAVTSVATAVLNYSVDGVAVPKNVQRQTLVFDNYSGTFYGVYRVQTAGCANPANNQNVAIPTIFTVTQSGSSMTIIAAASNSTCTSSGTYTQYGRIGQFNASYSCNSGEAGTVTFFDMNIQQFGLLSRVVGSNNLGCTISAHIGAAN